MVNFPEDFVKRVKAEFPMWTDNMFDDLNSNSVNYLFKQSQHFDMSSEEILAAFNEGREHEVKEAAERVIRRTQLYREWCDLRESFFKTQRQ